MAGTSKDFRSLFMHLLDGMTNAELIASKIKIYLSAEIGKYQVKNHLSQKDFAKILGVSQPMVSKYEGGDYNFTIDSLAQIADKMNMDLNVTFTARDTIGSNLSKSSTYINESEPGKGIDKKDISILEKMDRFEKCEQILINQDIQASSQVA